MTDLARHLGRVGTRIRRAPEVGAVVGEGSVAMGDDATGGRRGSGPTREGATGTGVDGPVAGATALLTLYGIVVVVADLLFGQSLVPGSGLAVAAVMVGLLLVGAVLGAGAAARSRR